MFGFPWSFRIAGPAHQQPRRVALRTTMSAIISCTSWKLAIGTPNCSRSLGVGDRCLDAALADSDAAGRDGVATRVERRHRDLESVAHLSEQRVVGDLDLVQAIAAVSEARRPSLPWISCDEKPSLAVGTRKQAMPA